MKDNGKLTNTDHSNMDVFLAVVLDEYRNGSISKTKAVSCLAHVIAAIDIGNYPEARSWFQNLGFLRDEKKGV